MHKLIVTSDGSHSLFNQSLNENYHSTYGAVQESKHIFIQSGLHAMAKIFDPVNILEIGLGTGLNAFLSCLESINNNLKINYTGIEPYPVPEAVIKELNYPGFLNAGEHNDLFRNIHNCSWSQKINLAEGFNFTKMNSGVEQLDFDVTFELIYFDAFSPEVQPEMWNEAVFNKMYKALKKKGCLVTYCSKGEVKRTLKKAGFTVEKIAGPPGKREIVRAVK